MLIILPMDTKIIPSPKLEPTTQNSNPKESVNLTLYIFVIRSSNTFILVSYKFTFLTLKPFLTKDY